MKKKELVISLIHDDLINLKLVYALGDIGLNADEYMLHLSSTIFKLMGLEITDQLTEDYLELTKEVRNIEVFGHYHTLHQLATNIYTSLLLQRNNPSKTHSLQSRTIEFQN